MYINTHATEEDLLEEIQVYTRLPTYILETQTRPMCTNATPAGVREAVAGVCKAVLTLNPFPTLPDCGQVGSGTLQLSPQRPPGTDLKVGMESRRHEEVFTGRWCHEAHVIHTN